MGSTFGNVTSVALLDRVVQLLHQLQWFLASSYLDPGFEPLISQRWVRRFYPFDNHIDILIYTQRNVIAWNRNQLENGKYNLITVSFNKISKIYLCVQFYYNQVSLPNHQNKSIGFCFQNWCVYASPKLKMISNFNNSIISMPAIE